MPQIINTNIASLNSQRNLNKSQSQLGVSLQRLSSGLRINSAKDDAAGLAISERFTTQIRGINQAVRNANDGVSLAQTAEGDLAQITNNLQRIRELAVQSANATNSPSDRAALQLEVTQLVSEIDRVASTSAFNGVKLLDGSFASQLFQVGANSGETVSIDNISSSRTDALGQTQGYDYTAAASPVLGDLTAGQLEINGVDIGAVNGDAADIKAAIEAKLSGSVTATATNSQDITFNDVVGVVGSPATSANVTFGTYTEAVSDGSDAIGAKYTSTADAVDSFADYRFNNVTFQVSVDGGSAQEITLDKVNGDATAVLADINDDLSGATATVEGGKFVITSDATDGTSAISVSNLVTDPYTDYTGGASVASNGTLAAVFTGTTTIDEFGFDYTGNQLSFRVAETGTSPSSVLVTLNTDLTGDRDTILDEINQQLTDGGSTVTATLGAGGVLELTGTGTTALDDIVVDSTTSNPNTFAFVTGATAAVTPAVAATTSFKASIDGIQLYAEGAAPGATVTGAELDAALTTFLATNTDYTRNSATGFADNNLVLTRADGTNIAVTIDTNFAGTAGAFTGALTSVDGVAVDPATNPTYTLQLNGTGLNLATGGSDGTLDGAEVASAIVALGGYTASYDAGTDLLTVASNDGSNIELVEAGSDSDGAEGLVGGAASAGVTTGVLRGSLDLSSLSDELVVGGTSAAQAGLTAATYSVAGAATGTTITDTTVATVNGANAAILSVDSALTEISTSRSSLGAIQNRFESVVSSLSTSVENLSAARSRIRDADFAQETAALTRNQILQQAGVSILSQANALPQLALSLLQ